MRILHVIANLAPRYGGPSTAAMGMAVALANRGHEVEIFTTDQDGRGRLNVTTNQPVSHNGVTVWYFRASLRFGWAVSLPLAKALRSRIREFDVVHIHSLYLFHDVVAGHFCRKYQVPYIVRPHGTLDPYIFARHRLRKALFELAVERRNLRWASRIHYTTREEMILAQSVIKGMAPGAVVPLGLHGEKYQTMPPPGAFRRNWPEIGQRWICLFLGRVNFKKGLDVLLPAFSEVSKARSDTHLVIAGPEDEGYAQQVRKWVRELNLQDHVTFTGMLLGDEKLAAFKDANAFVLPSYSENFGISVVEAMLSGLPVIVSNKVNLWTDIAEAEAGLIIENDVGQLKDAILRLHDDPECAREIGARGQRLAQLRYNWGAIARQLEDMYTASQSGAVI